MKRLILLRGNSGSGKTTVAKLLQEQLGRHTMLISQDVIRREVLKARETENHPTMELILQMTRFGWENGWQTVILEGIFHKEKYKQGLKELIAQADQAYVYYFDIPFEETLRRHATKPVANDYGEKEMREWWKEKDYLQTPAETIVRTEMRKDQIVNLILTKITQ